MAGTNIETSEDSGEKSEWVRAHEALSLLARERAAADAEEGRWFLAALRSAAHVHLGYGSFGEYIERLFGYKPRSTQEKLRVAEGLEKLPAFAEALASGALNWSAARELTRVAVPETESAWLDVARGKTVHQVEALVAGKSPGDGPSSAGQPDARRHVLRYQIVVSVCAQCGRGYQHANGELIPVSAEVVAMADCDGQHLEVIAPPIARRDSPPVASRDPAGDECAHVGAARLGAHVGVRAKQAVSPATRRAVLLRDHERCVVPGCRNAQFLDVHHVELRSEVAGTMPTI
ncbi:MAG TPA: hypothetical protein VH062_19210 [Polyangiaceae bacterium]|jgi:hypothetical protein|nr:hypothetical protein [Polyangiaceae bacterium]